MKTKIRRYVGMAALMAALTAGFSSCDVTFYPGEYPITMTDYLCGPVWTDVWEADYHHYEQRFVFYSGGRGVEYFYDNGLEWRYDFWWEWENGNARNIRMVYADGTSYLDDIIIQRGVLRGYLNNEYVEFVAR